MEVRFYNRDLNFLGLIENQSSLIWTRRYFEPGAFELHCPITDYNRQLVQMGNLIWLKGASEAAIIESIVMEQSQTKKEITAKGRFLESYLDRRLVKGTYNANNSLVETEMRTLITNAVAIPKLELANPIGDTTRVTYQVTYKNLLNTIQKLSSYSNLGFRIRPDFNGKKMIFETYKGLDRSIGQSDRNRVVFSEDYNNISNATYTENSQTHKTKIYVGGQGEGDDRTIVSVGSGTGFDLREDFYSVSDVSPDGLTTSEYQAALMQKGNEKLDATALVKSFECTTEADSNFIYKVNYDLGDIVTIKKPDWGVSIDLRITELTEVYEYGSMSVSPTFGNPLPTTIDWGE